MTFRTRSLKTSWWTPRPWDQSSSGGGEAAGAGAGTTPDEEQGLFGRPVEIESPFQVRFKGTPTMFASPHFDIPKWALGCCTCPLSKLEPVYWKPFEVP